MEVHAVQGICSIKLVLAGVEDVLKYPAIVRGLMDLGYSDEDVRKIMGMNLIRVLRANEALAGRK
jgi:microsomal dipeptidase-like Zn-dependent dipeptidase